MGKAIFFNVPASGHVNPSLPIVAELVRRGEQVIYYLTEGYRHKIEATGATFRPYRSFGDDYFDVRGLNGSEPPRAAETLMTTSREILDELLDIVRAEAPDYVLYDSMCPWGRLVAQILHVPSVSSMSLLAFSPAMILKSGMLLEMLPDLFKGLRYIMRFNSVAGEIATRYRLKPMAFMDAFNAPADLMLNYTSTLLQPDVDQVDPRIKFVGPSIEARIGDDDFPYDQLDAQKPLVYISLGTVINTNISFFQACLQAFADTPYQIVMSIGQRLNVNELGVIPANFIIRSFVPQLKILERASLFITHAGMNSVQEGLYYDVPLLLVPRQAEQSFVAARIQHLGAGLRLARRHQSAAQIRQHTERILHNATYKAAAARLGASLRDAGGYRRAADEIMAMLQKTAIKV